jgi:HK97 family phage major capsid protein
MTIQELRAKAAAAIANAAKIRDDGRPWPEKQKAFDALVKEATDAQKDIQSMETHQAQMDQFSALEKHFLAPVQTVRQPAAEITSGGNPAEVFGRYLKTARFNQGKGCFEARGFNQETLDRCVEMHHEAFRAYMRGDIAGLNAYAQQAGIKPAEIQALLSNDNTLGGFLVPEDWRAEVIKAEAGFEVLAALCRLEPTNSDTLIFPKMNPHSSDVRRTSGFAGQWQQQGYVTGGTAPTVQNYPRFSQVRIPVHSWQPDAVEVSPELFEDSGANVEQIVAQAIGECLGLDKDDAILSGVGIKDPEGILNAGLSSVNSGGATSIAIGGIIGMYTEVPAQYRRNSTWVMASRTMGAVLQLNTGTGGVYLFPPNQWNNTILGRPVVFLDYGMDTATAAGGTTFTAGNKPVIFGDWKRYIIAQRAGLRIQRLIERFAPNIGFLPTARLGGQCVLTDAFRIMNVAA